MKNGLSLKKTSKSLNPFIAHNTASLKIPTNLHRLKIYRRFIGFPITKNLKALDVGGKNFIGNQLGISHFTSGDLNVTMKTQAEEYDLITCFEVISHTWNQGIVLDNIRKKLKVGGRLYLATPLRYGLSTIHGEGNYAEVTKLSMTKLLEYKGFKILRYEVHRSYPLRCAFSGLLQPLRFATGRHFEDGIKAPKMKWKFLGLRPVYKYLFHKFQLIEAELV